MSQSKCRSFHHEVAFLASLTFLFRTSGISQSPPVSSAPAKLISVKLPQDHPALYEAFFRVAFVLENLHAQRKGQAAGGQLSQVDSNFAKVFRISSPELEKVFEATRRAKAEIQAIEGQMRSHANERARKELFPDAAVMRRLGQQRDVAFQSNMARLRNLVSPATSVALSNYINTDLRNSISAAQPAENKP